MKTILDKEAVMAVTGGTGGAVMLTPEASTAVLGSYAGVGAKACPECGEDVDLYVADGAIGMRCDGSGSAAAPRRGCRFELMPKPGGLLVIAPKPPAPGGAIVGAVVAYDHRGPPNELCPTCGPDTGWFLFADGPALSLQCARCGEWRK